MTDTPIYDELAEQYGEIPEGEDLVSATQVLPVVQPKPYPDPGPDPIPAADINPDQMPPENGQHAHDGDQ